MSLFKWTVIGAGPAGIAAVGKLLDHGISPETIAWIDPHFQVGDLGRKWSSVSSNTKVALFLQFLNNCKAFSYESAYFPLHNLDPQTTCLLKYVVEPLQWITDHLKNTVTSFHDTAISITPSHSNWEIKTHQETLLSKNVILAIGAEEKRLSFPTHEVIPLEIALDAEKLKSAIHINETIGVFGSSHSAILILANLIKTHQVINFYRTPHHYAIYEADKILFDNTGLKGYAAEWAKNHLDDKRPPNLTRLFISDSAFKESVSLCNKLIYAVGFERRSVQGVGPNYDHQTGIIAPGLFGLGIAFPQMHYDSLMNVEYRVGLWKFMDYLNTVLPLWINLSKQRFPVERSNKNTDDAADVCGPIDFFFVDPLTPKIATDDDCDSKNWKNHRML